MHALPLEALRDMILPLREQMRVRNAWLKERLDTLLPELMARENLDMWLVIAREYNEDPIIMTLLPEPAMSARRRTILVFIRREDGKVERLTLSRYGYEGFYEPAWNPEEEADQYARLAQVVEEFKPKQIGLNIGTTFAFGDGLSHGEYEQLRAALGPEVMARTTSAERLCVGWLERRIPAEMAVYPQLIAIGHSLLATAFSRRVITPGVTHVSDVQWWLRDALQSLGLRAWFHPSFDLQALDERYDKAEGKRQVIQPGDLLWCDMGFSYLGLNTDQQQHGYVLRPGEFDAPEDLKALLKHGNQLQDIHLDEMTVGSTGNEVLQRTLVRAKEAGINPQVYSHPLGYHGHAAGPTIGLWDRQDGVPGNGDYPIFDDTAYSIELNVRGTVPSWDNQEVRIMLEEDALFHAGRCNWLDGRQEAFYLI